MSTQYQERPAARADDLLTAAKAMLAQGRLDEARHQVDTHLGLRPNDHRGLFLRARIKEHGGDLPGALAAMQEAVDARGGRNARHVAHLVRLLMANDRHREAGELVEASLARLGDRAVLLAQGLRHAAAAGDLERAARYGHRYLAVATDDPDAKPAILVALARQSRDYRHEERAMAIVEQGLRRWPGFVPLLLAKVSLCASIGHKASARAVLRDQVLAQAELEPDVKARALDRLAFLEGRAYVGLDGGMAHVPGEAVQDELAVAMNGDSRQGVFVRRSPGSRKMLLVFTGLAREAGGVPLALLDATLRKLPVHVVYLRDFQRLLYLGGVADLGADFDQTIAGLRALQQELGAADVFCLGNSAGGYAAIRYGVALQADTVVGLAAQTTTDASTVRNFDERGESIGVRLQEEVPQMLGNLRDDLERAARPPRVLLYFGADMPQDRGHADNLAGLPDTHLFALPGVDRHDLTGLLLAEGRLEQVIREAVRE